MSIFRKFLVFLAPMLLFSSLVSTKTLISNSYREKKLVANLAGQANHTDARLVNPWGLTFARGGHLIVAINEGENLAAAYNQDGSIRKGLISGEFHPTGLETNHEHDDFFIGTAPNRQAARLLFATEAGLILAYNHHISSDAFVAADRSGNDSIYKGLALAESTEEPGHQRIFAADFHNSTIDVFDHDFQYVTSFNDNTIPSNFAPFNIQNINGLLYVTYALQDGGGEDDVPGPGNGFINVFQPDGTFVKRLVSNGVLNSPWGLALAPANFGRFSGALLVGNFGDGLIHAFNIQTGAHLGNLEDKHGNDIIIDGLWSIKFHPKDTSRPHLYFTAGPDHEENGLVGVILANHN